MLIILIYKNGDFIVFVNFIVKNEESILVLNSRICFNFSFSIYVLKSLIDWVIFMFFIFIKIALIFSSLFFFKDLQIFSYKLTNFLSNALVFYKLPIDFLTVACVIIVTKTPIYFLRTFESVFRYFK